jgi:hypothetical protein
MVTIPKLMEPLQIALGISAPPDSTQHGFGADTFPQSAGLVH